MKKILILQNIANEGPGLIEEFLKETGLEYEIINRDASNKNSPPEKIPPLKNYSAMIVMGGSDSANDQSEKILGNLDAVREALQIKMPYLGVCLGLQLGVKAAGGKVIKNSIRETGCRDPRGDFFSVKLVPNHSPKNDHISINTPTTDPILTTPPLTTSQIFANAAPTANPILTNLPQNFPVFHLHGETVELTPQMQLLGSGKFCRNQFVKIAENAYGIQFHLELTPEMFEDWAANDPWLQELNQEQLRKDFASQRENYRKIFHQIFRNFLKTANLRP